MKALLKVLPIAISLICVDANAAGSLDAVFDDLNGNVSYGGPAAVQMQTMNYYHGGNLTIATPSRSYNLMSIQAPTVNAGCGGIDLHLGGFSFISKEQFVQTLRNIGSNALGYGFKVALQNICPTCENVMTSLQNVADKANALNISSCQAAKGIVNAAANEVFNTQYDTKVMDWGMIDGLYRDATDAYRQVKNLGNPQTRKDALAQARQNNPAREEELPVGNVTWNALSKVTGLSDVEKRRFMGMIGTVVFDENGDAKSYFPPEDYTTKKMISTEGRIPIPLPICNNPDCTSVNFDNKEMADSFKTLVLERMRYMERQMVNRQPYGSRKDEMLAFVNATEIPVYKIVALSSSLGRQGNGVASSMINNYSSLIAAKYAQAYVATVSSTLRKALQRKIDKEQNAAQTTAAKELLQRVDKLESDLNRDVEQLYSSAQTSFAVAQEVKFMENTMMGSMSSTIANSLAFGNSLK